MREAVGGTFLFEIVIVFIFFFTAFIAIAINYSQAFQMKNKVINAIEQAEGYNNISRKKIRESIETSSYYRNITCPVDYDVAKSESSTGSKVLNGICISKHDSGTPNSAYYSVMTYVNFDLPIVGRIIVVPVKGETKLIVNNIYEN